MGNKNYRQDIIPGLVLMLFSGAYLLGVPTIKEFKGLGATPLTNRFTPLLWGSVLLFLGAWIFVRGLIKRKKYFAEGGKPVKAENFFTKEREVVASFIALAIYVAILSPVGFIISTILFLTAQILILTPMGKWKKTIIPALIVAVIFGIGLDYIFKVLLNVLLPTGLIGW